MYLIVSSFSFYSLCSFAQGLKMMLKFLRRNPETGHTGKILQAVLEGVLLNKHVIDICDDLSEMCGGPSGPYFSLGFDSREASVDTNDDDASVNSLATEYTAASSAASATSYAFKMTTFSKILTSSFRIIEKCTKSTLTYRDLGGSTRIVDVIKTLLAYASGGCNRYFLRNERNKSYFAIPIPKVVDKDFVKFSSLKSVMHILTPSPILNILQRNRGLSIAALARRLISEGQVRTS